MLILPDIEITTRELDTIIALMTTAQENILLDSFHDERAIRLSDGRSWRGMKFRGLVDNDKPTALGLLVRKRLVERRYKIADLDHITEEEANNLLNLLVHEYEGVIGPLWRNGKAMTGYSRTKLTVLRKLLHIRIAQQEKH